MISGWGSAKPNANGPSGERLGQLRRTFGAPGGTRDAHSAGS